MSKKEEENNTSSPDTSQGIPAEVIQVVGRESVIGEVIQVRTKVLAGPSQGRVLTRNLKGPVMLGDILMLKDTEREARKSRRR